MVGKISCNLAEIGYVQGMNCNDLADVLNHTSSYAEKIASELNSILDIDTHVKRELENAVALANELALRLGNASDISQALGPELELSCINSLDHSIAKHLASANAYALACAKATITNMYIDRAREYAFLISKGYRHVNELMDSLAQASSIASELPRYEILGPGQRAHAVTVADSVDHALTADLEIKDKQLRRAHDLASELTSDLYEKYQYARLRVVKSVEHILQQGDDIGSARVNKRFSTHVLDAKATLDIDKDLQRYLGTCSVHSSACGIGFPTADGELRAIFRSMQMRAMVLSVVDDIEYFKLHRQFSMLTQRLDGEQQAFEGLRIVRVPSDIIY